MELQFAVLGVLIGVVVIELLKIQVGCGED
jgi:hypothetical protein